MKKRAKLSLFLAAWLLPFMSLSSIAQAYSGTGAGTSGSPYQISTCSQLEEVNNNLSAYYALVSPVDCAGVAFTPIGNIGAAFTGHFEGNGFAIENVTINSNGTDSAVFGRISGGTVNHVVISSATITGGSNYSAGFAGQVDTNASVSGIHVMQSRITGQDEVAGIAASMDSSAVTDSTVSNTTVNGSIANPGSTNNIGGAIGQSTNSTYSLMSVNSTTVNGNIDGSASSSVGGFVGSSHGDTFNDTYSTAAVYGNSRAGGFVGSSASSTIRRSYASGAVTGTTYVGGFSGYEGLDGIIDSFAAGSVTGTTAVGGLIGDVEAIGGDATNSYFDETRTGQTDCVGQDNGISFPTNCTGVNSANAQPGYFFNNSTNQPLANWDFTNVWRTTSSFPVLITAPGMTTNVRVVRGATSIQVFWAAPADDGGSPVTGYDFGYRLYGSQDPFVITTGLSASTLSRTVAGLTPGARYEFAIRANNAVGTGTWTILTSSASNATTVGAPDTGFGAASVSNIKPHLLLFGALCALSSGFLLLHRDKRERHT